MSVTACKAAAIEVPVEEDHFYTATKFQLFFLTRDTMQPIKSYPKTQLDRHLWTCKTIGEITKTAQRWSTRTLKTTLIRWMVELLLLPAIPLSHREMSYCAVYQIPNTYILKAKHISVFPDVFQKPESKGNCRRESVSIICLIKFQIQRAFTRHFLLNYIKILWHDFPFILKVS